MASDEGHNYYYSDEIKLLLETHVEYFRREGNFAYFNVTPIIAYRYEGDFYGLLTALNVPQKYHWIVMRVNNLNSPFANKSNKLTYMQPLFDQVELVINMYRSSNGLRA